MSERALIVDDDAIHAGLVGGNLAQNGFAVWYATDARRALALSEKNSFDLVVLDASTVGLDAVDLCDRLRAVADASLVVLISSGEDRSRERALVHRADACVRRAGSPSELLSSVNSVMSRRASNRPPLQLTAGELHINAAEREARMGSLRVKLTTIELQLLSILARSPGMTIARETLRSMLSTHGELLGDRGIDVHVCHLRTKLRAICRRSNLITTVRGIGYQLLAIS